MERELLLARLSAVGSDNKMNRCLDEYLKRMEDQKFLTAVTCIEISGALPRASPSSSHPGQLTAFASAHVGGASPKTRKIAADFLKAVSFD